MKTLFNISLLVLLVWSCEQKVPKVKVLKRNKQQSLAVNKPKEQGPVTIYSPPTVVTEAPEKTAWHPHGDSVLGIWKMTRESYDNMIGVGPTLFIEPAIFRYDGTYVTTNFLCVWNSWTPKWISKDGFYKLKSRWNNDTLFYRTPFGDWKEAGVFGHGNFNTVHAVNDSAHVIRFRKISRSDAHNDEKAIFKPRKPHNYALSMK
ncbi:MAG TPA: hypothetical protein VK151_03605 [Fluviicola sp.]|nr:hypothetical protein [Fluviicola sp.]